MESLGLLAPFHNQMILGQGFNSFSQEGCLVDAVKINNEERPVRGRSPSPVRIDGSALSPPVLGRSSLSRQPSSSGRPRSNAASIHSVTDEERNMILAPKKAHNKQKVVFETRMVSSKADVDHSLGVSSYASLTAGNQGGKAAAFVDNDGESHDGDIHYHVKVVVTNEAHNQDQNMEFHDYTQFTDKLVGIARRNEGSGGAAASEFTRVYGDRFISGFVEGGSLSAVISIKLHDKKDSKRVRTEASAKLAMGQTPFSGEAGGSVDNKSSSAFTDNETLINVRWVGGGQTPVEEQNWDMNKLIKVANAFPGMVAQSSNKLFAVLTPYTSLGSFLDWQMKHSLEGCLLDYTKCEEYMSILLSDFNALESVQRDIDRIMTNRSYYRPRKPKTSSPDHTIHTHDDATQTDTNQRRRKALSVGSIPTIAQVAPTPISPTAGPAGNRFSTLSTELEYPRRSSESDIAVHRAELWVNDESKYNLDPIQPDLPGLDMARWLCCQARMSIKEEAETLVLHPEKAVLKSPEGHRMMRTPDYLRPLVLKECLPEYHGPEIGEADPIVPNYVVRSSDYFVAPIVGDEPTRHRAYQFRYSNEPPSLEAAHEISIRMGGFAPGWFASKFGRECRGAIGSVELGFQTKAAKGIGALKRSASKRVADAKNGVRVGKMADVSKVVVWHRDGSGFVQGLEFFDKHGSCVVGWKQWGNAAEVPEGVVEHKLTRPTDGSEWRFAGLGTEWDVMTWGCFGGQVLSRVAAVWKRV